MSLVDWALQNPRTMWIVVLITGVVLIRYGDEIDLVDRPVWVAGVLFAGGVVVYMYATGQLVDLVDWSAQAVFFVLLTALVAVVVPYKKALRQIGVDV